MNNTIYKFKLRGERGSRGCVIKYVQLAKNGGITSNQPIVLNLPRPVDGDVLRELNALRYFALDSGGFWNERWNLYLEEDLSSIRSRDSVRTLKEQSGVMINMEEYAHAQSIFNAVHLTAVSWDRRKGRMVLWANLVNGKLTNTLTCKGITKADYDNYQYLVQKVNVLFNSLWLTIDSKASDAQESENAAAIIGDLPLDDDF